MDKQTKEQLLQLKKEALQEQYKEVVGDDADTSLTKEQLAEAIIAKYPPEENPEQGNDKEPDNQTAVEPAAATIGSESLVASSERLGTPIPDVDVNVGLTQVEIGYPADFKGTKYFEDGAKPFVSSEVAEQFVKAGIATIN